MEYKFLIKSVDGTVVGWQPGENRHIEVPESGFITVVDGWDIQQPSILGESGKEAVQEVVATQSNGMGSAVADAIGGSPDTPFPSIDPLVETTDLMDAVIEMVEFTEDKVEDLIEEKSNEN